MKSTYFSFTCYHGAAISNSWQLNHALWYAAQHKIHSTGIFSHNSSVALRAGLSAWRIRTTISWTATEFGVYQRINAINSGELLAFPLAPHAVQSFHFSTETSLHVLDVWLFIWLRQLVTISNCWWSVGQKNTNIRPIQLDVYVLDGDTIS